jgi:hypothetical protein
MFFAVYYGGLFGLVAIAAAAICIVVRKLRRYTLRALVGPVAFGFCSVVGFIIAILLVEEFYRGPTPGPVVGYSLAAIIYFGCGLLGTWIAFAILKPLEPLILRFLSFR